MGNWLLIRSLIKKLLFFTGLALFFLFTVNSHIKSTGEAHRLKPEDNFKAQTAIVLGAYVSPQGQLCDMLVDRVQTAVDLYKSGKVEKLLMTGDHGSTTYDEVNHMRLYAEKLGIPTEDIFMDHAGFSTYDSMVRAVEVFCVQSAVIVTQEFHLPRATYIARSLGMEARGVAADRHLYRGVEYNEAREILARNKDFVNVHLFQPEPKFLGPAISITGDGRQTHDQ
ncbi:SanA/YdcF family protein [Desulforamulus ruminis]|uniref:DUF218 domain-containing protein n=1 Tax=Desulforamulus ruminis (strain ATCC 23193 / DSM 2154 / NCIMB 8452 / DL) TaxID=696281 RepID=F6DSP2_DESRL|nr:ElyC/SanA/YdcF family protein [Desulforamulus ruminis]AEG58861.1 protein of unknown function DUF218 [Desulforamulus ruminis DSM 2154]